jgi:SAM-dependent methyltransferase
MTTSSDNGRRDRVWQAGDLSRAYLDGVRGAIPLAAEQIDAIVRLLRLVRPSVSSVLDLGCGDGVLGHAVAEAYADDAPRVILADFSAPMLEAARQKLAGVANAVFVEADYATPAWLAAVAGDGLPDHYDVVVSGFSIHHQPDARKREVYAEIFRLLNPGGVFLNLEHVASATWLGERLFAERMIDSLYAYHASKPDSAATRDQIARDYYHRPDKDANLLAPVEMQLQWLRELGFADVDCFLKVYELALFGGVKPA